MRTTALLTAALLTLAALAAPAPVAAPEEPAWGKPVTAFGSASAE